MPGVCQLAANPDQFIQLRKQAELSRTRLLNYYVGYYLLVIAMKATKDIFVCYNGV